MLGCMQNFPSDSIIRRANPAEAGPVATTTPSRHASIRVSVIIPAFNAAACIERCLKSVIAQAFESVEIIVIDDGSTDATAKVVASVARQHPAANIRLHSQPNQGVSVARNNGLALACGRYILFADADDHLAHAALSKLWSRAEADGLDVLLCNAWWHGLSAKAPTAMMRGFADWTGTGPTWLVERVADRQLKHYVWCQFVRRDWLLKTGVRFIVGITHQDIVWTNEILWRAKRVGFSNHAGYHHHQRAGSLSQPRDSRSRLRAASHYLRVARELDNLASRTSDAALQRAFAWQATEEGIAVLQIARHLTGAHREQLFATLAVHRHLPLLWRNALTIRHRYRVLKRSARFIGWWTVRSLLESLRGRDTVVASHAAPNSQFGAD